MVLFKKNRDDKPQGLQLKIQSGRVKINKAKTWTQQ